MRTLTKDGCLRVQHAIEDEDGEDLEESHLSEMRRRIKSSSQDQGLKTEAELADKKAATKKLYKSKGAATAGASLIQVRSCSFRSCRTAPLLRCCDTEFLLFYKEHTWALSPILSPSPFQ